MNISKFQNTGYLQIDHRESPGLTNTEIRNFGSHLPPDMGRMNFETAVVKCWHCQTMIMLNPLRERHRHFCHGCDRYICNQCYAAYKATGVCKPFTKVIEEILEAAERALSIQEI